MTNTSNLSKACYFHIRDLRRVRPTLDLDTARTIATSLVHYKLDYCNSLYYNFPQSQLKRLQAIKKLLGSLRHIQLSFPTHNTWNKISSLA